MKKRSFGRFLPGAILGGALAIGSVAWAHSGDSGEGGMDGMMNGGMMGMHKMMEQGSEMMEHCSQMMEGMQSQRDGAAGPDA